MANIKHDHTQITSPDPEKVADFYQNVIGAKFLKKQQMGSGEVTDLDLGGVLIRISKSSAVEKERYGVHHFGLVVENAEKTVAEIKAKGVEIMYGPKINVSTGSTIAFIKGPDGVIFEIIQKKK